MLQLEGFPLIRFSYLGDRNYISISQVVEEFLRAKGATGGGPQFYDFCIRVRRPILNDCRLVPISSDLPLDDSRIVADYRYKKDGHIVREGLVSDRQVITARSPEPALNISKHLKFEGRTGSVIEATDHFAGLILMAIGKQLMLNNTPHKNPRVVVLYTDPFPKDSEQINCQMILAPTSQNGFYRMEIRGLQPQKKIGYAIVHRGPA